MKALLFPGQGSQFKGMGQHLFALYPGLTRVASDIVGYDLKELCLENPENKLSQTEYTQPALYTVNALAYFERQHRGEPRADFLLGHSLGEYNALLAARVFDFETGLRLVIRRGRLMASAPAGGMIAVAGLTAKELRAFLQEEALEGLDLANYNTATQIVVAGDTEGIDRASRALRRKDITVIPLNVSAPFHSRYMKRAASDFNTCLSQFTFAEPQVPVISNTTARAYDRSSIGRTLSAQIESPVLWMQSIQYLIGIDGQMEFEEVGSSFLTKMVKAIKLTERTRLAASSSSVAVP